MINRFWRKNSFSFIFIFIFTFCGIFFLYSFDLIAHTKEEDSTNIKEFVSDFIHSLDPDHSCSCEEGHHHHEDDDSIDIDIDHICECDHVGCSCSDICDSDTHNHNHIHNENTSSYFIVVGRYLKKTIFHIKDALNIKELIWKVRRYASMKKNISSAMREHLLNLMIIWPLSESMEVLSAPIVGSLGIKMDLPSTIMIPLVTTLSFIALPGVCPLCTILLVVYPIKPVHRGITKIRTFVFKILSKKIPYTEGISFFNFMDRIKYIKEKHDIILNKTNYDFRVDSSSSEDSSIGTIEVVGPGSLDPLIQIAYFYEDKDPYVSVLKLDRSFFKLSPKDRKKIVKEFGSNLYNFSSNASFFDKNPDLSKVDDKTMFFVENFENKEEFQIRFKKTSMFFSKKVECTALFSRED